MKSKKTTLEYPENLTFSIKNLCLVACCALKRMRSSINEKISNSSMQNISLLIAPTVLYIGQLSPQIFLSERFSIHRKLCNNYHIHFLTIT